MTRAGVWLAALSGLPGVGKTTLSRLVAPRLGAVALRVDTVETAMSRALGLDPDVGPAGYLVAQAVARDLLLAGTPVIADCVNDVEAARVGWRALAARTGAVLVRVEIRCSDRARHRARVEGRAPDLPGQRLPDWARVAARAFDPAEPGTAVVETGDVDVATAAARLEAAIREGVGAHDEA